MLLLANFTAQLSPLVAGKGNCTTKVLSSLPHTTGRLTAFKCQIMFQ